jgi:hypothetical protein
MTIIINIDKAKLIAHDIRRQKRATEFAPLDQAIAMRLPYDNLDLIEEEREAIRQKYAEIQDAIESAQTIDEIKTAIEEVI